MPLQSNSDRDFDARWTAWLARGAAHDRALRHRFVIIIMPAAVVVAVGICLLLLR